MTATQLLQAVGPELRDEIITYIQTQERAAYRVVIQNLSAARRLRPVLIFSSAKVILLSNCSPPCAPLNTVIMG